MSVSVSENVYVASLPLSAVPIVESGDMTITAACVPTLVLVSTISSPLMAAVTLSPSLVIEVLIKVAKAAVVP